MAIKKVHVELKDGVHGPTQEQMDQLAELDSRVRLAQDAYVRAVVFGGIGFAIFGALASITLGAVVYTLWFIPSTRINQAYIMGCVAGLLLMMCASYSVAEWAYSVHRWNMCE